MKKVSWIDPGQNGVFRGPFLEQKCGVLKGLKTAVIRQDLRSKSLRQFALG